MLRYDVGVIFHKDFVKVEGDTVSVGLMSRPEGGKANRELIQKLAEHFRVSTSQVRLISGLKSKRKIVEIITE